jgi:hypothetical protein
MTRLAIVTGADAPDLTSDGQRLAAALEERGVSTDAARWDDPSVEWERFDAALVRSCWEYYRDLDRFERLLEELEAADITVRNSRAWSAGTSTSRTSATSPGLVSR